MNSSPMQRGQARSAPRPMHALKRGARTSAQSAQIWRQPLQNQQRPPSRRAITSGTVTLTNRQSGTQRAALVEDTLVVVAVRGNSMAYTGSASWVPDRFEGVRSSGWRVSKESCAKTACPEPRSPLFSLIARQWRSRPVEETAMAVGRTALYSGGEDW